MNKVRLTAMNAFLLHVLISGNRVNGWNAYRPPYISDTSITNSETYQKMDKKSLSDSVRCLRLKQTNPSTTLKPSGIQERKE